MPQIPVGWTKCLLGDVLTVKNGYAFKSSDYASEGIPLIRISDIQNGKVSTLNAALIPQNQVNPDFLVERGDLLIAMSGATTGKTGIYEGLEPCLQNQRVGNFKIYSENLLDRKFRNFYIYSLRKQIEITAYGGAQPNISSSLLESFEILLPPLTEQRCIVAKLEKLLAKVDSCKDRLDKIPTILKRFRQSVLAAACSGRLTADWRENNPDVEPASELISSMKTPYPENYLDTFQESSDNEIPSSWVWVPLGKLGTFTGGGTPSKANPDFWNGSIPWVSPKDMKQDRIHDATDYISEEAVSNSSVKNIPQGSILFVVRGMILNHTLPVAIADSIITINQDMKALTPEHLEMSEYLLIASKLVSRNILFAVKEATHGTRRIETPTLKSWAIPIPPIAEQQEIVHRVQSLFKLADQIEQRYQKAKGYVDQLTQSILAKAFRGELVPQDPNDEPASVLLERIRAERAKREAVPT
jgi:type I restriction enzyme S subunit